MLRKLGLKNFKAFSELELPFGSLTLLSGLNGSGKSSVLQSLGLLRQSYDSEDLTRGELDLNGPLVSIGTGRDVLYQSFVDPEIGIWCEFAIPGYVETLEWKARAEVDADVLLCDQVAREQLLDRHNLFGRGFQFLRADRITPSVTFPMSQHTVVHDRSLGPRGEYTAHFLLKFGAELVVAPSLRVSIDDAGASLLAQVNAWMQHVSPGVRVEPVGVPMTDLVRLAYSFRGEKASYGDPLRPTNVGFGLTHVLPILAGCLAAEPGTLVVVENPEAQLHPLGQAAMGRLLALTAALGVQVIVETHSDHVLNGIRLAVKQGHLEPSRTLLHFFSRQPGEAGTFETPTIAPDGRLSYWPSGFFDQWERSLDQLLS